MPLHHEAVAVSAPGKVLLAGGYLVLDRAHTGLVFGLDARIHIVVQPIETSNGVVLSEITVRSPQFVHAVWEYGYTLAAAEDGGMRVTQLRADADLHLDRNPFIETALTYALSYIGRISPVRITPAAVDILADNDYYSTPADLDISNASGDSSRFHRFGVPLNQAHKTGLGSSAALVTSFLGALLSYYLPADLFDLQRDESRRRLHNLAQAAHCAAQGKVGSGFDVASAVYGSCVYRRFSPSILSAPAEPGQPGFGADLAALVEQTWDVEVRRDAVRVPRGLRVVLCDVSGGSQTPGMVKQVLAWRTQQPDAANALWAELQVANDDLAQGLQAVAAAQEASASNGETNHAPAPAQGDVDYTPLRTSLGRIRALLRAMSAQSGVPIEPAAQTRLLDACSELDGVLGGVVPGAGGYDAIALLIEDREATIASLRRLVAGWTFDDGAEGHSEGTVSMLGVREDMSGVRREDASAYAKWLH